MAIFNGEAEAKLIALACSPPPKGRTRWTLQLLEKKVVELAIVAQASDNTIGRTLKKTLKPHRQRQWVIPPEGNAAFIAALEDVLEVYTRPRDPRRPLVCLDETSKQLVRETRAPIAMRAGRPACHDDEYERNGTANIFMLLAPAVRNASRTGDAIRFEAFALRTACACQRQCPNTVEATCCRI